jgi:hypothetical protein
MARSQGQYSMMELARALIIMRRRRQAPDSNRCGGARSRRHLDLRELVQ